MPLQHLSRFALELRVKAIVSCWPIRWPHLHSVPCCRILIPRCSVTPLSVSTTKLPKCVDQRASILQMSSASSSGNQNRRHRRVHRSARCSLLVAAGTPTRHVVCRKKYRPTRARRVKLLSRLRDYTPCLRMQCQAGPMPDMPVLLTRCDGLFAHRVPVPRGLVVRLALRRLGSSVVSLLVVQAQPLPVLRHASTHTRIQDFIFFTFFNFVSWNGFSFSVVFFVFRS